MTPYIDGAHVDNEADTSLVSDTGIDSGISSNQTTETTPLSYETSHPLSVFANEKEDGNRRPSASGPMGQKIEEAERVDELKQPLMIREEPDIIGIRHSSVGRNTKRCNTTLSS